MRRKYSEESLIQQLKRLPKIKDPRSKDEVYERLVLNIRRSRPRKRSTFSHKIIPIFSLSLAIVIILLISPSLFNDFFKRSIEDHTFESDEMIRSEIYADSSQEDGREEIEDGRREMTTEGEFESYLLYDVEKDQQIVYRAFVEEHLQYIIPVSYLISNDEDLEEAYASRSYTLKEEWTVLSDLLDGVSYTIDEGAKEVIIHLPDQFSVGESSIYSYLFTEVITMMFQPLGIQKAIFDFEGKTVDFGALGEIREITWDETIPASYKVLNHPDASRKFLVPVRTYDESIQDAFQDMKNDDPFYYVERTIPDQIEFTLQPKENELIVQFINGEEISDEAPYVLMIEAMLLTAKSYGYETVNFQLNHLTNIGPYDVTSSIQVPLGVNPIEG